MKAYTKDIVQTIKKEKKRFFAIMIICALGVCMLSGLKASCVDLRYSADKFFDEQNMFDISIVSTLGLTEEDINVLSKLEMVEDVEGSYNETVFTTVEESVKQAEMRVLSEKGINTPYLLEGEFPLCPDEILVTETYLLESGKKIGDTLVIEEDLGNSADEIPELDDNSDFSMQEESESLDDFSFEMESEEEEPNFLYTKYTIVGSVTDVLDINGSEGAISFRNNSSIDYTFFIMPEAVSFDVYTSAYLTLYDCEELLCYSDDYNKKVDTVVEILEEEIKADREKARYDEITGEAIEKLEDAENEMNDKFADAETQLADAKVQITDGWSGILSGEEELLNGEEDIEEGKRKLEKAQRELERAERQLSDAKSELDKAEEELEYGELMLQVSEIAVNGMESAITSLEETVKNSEDTFAKMESEISTQFEPTQVLLEGQIVSTQASIKDTEQKIATLEAEITKLKTELVQLEEKEAQGTISEEERLILIEKKSVLTQKELELSQKKTSLNTYESQLATYQDSLDNLKTQKDKAYVELEKQRQLIEEQRAKLESSRNEAIASKAELETNKKQLEIGRVQLEQGKKEFEIGKQQIANGWKELENGWDELENAYVKIADGWDELEDGKQELTDGESELEENVQEYEKKKQEALDLIADARHEIEDLKMTEWYISTRVANSGYSNVKTDAGCIEAIGDAFPIIFLTIAILISLTTISRMVEEDRGLIGVYKALGFTDKEIRRKYVVYAFLASFIGGIIGDLMGFVLMPNIIFYIFGVMYKIPTYMLTFDILYGVGGVILFIVGIVGASIVSCEAELSHMPAILMRPKAPKNGSRVFLERITPLWSRLSFLNKVTARNLFRYKKRLFMTLFGIAGCTALLVCGYMIKDTVTALMPSQYEETYMYDVMAVAEKNEKLLEYLEEDTSIRKYINTLITNVKLINEEGKEETVQLIVLPENESFRGFIHLYTKKGETLTLGKEDIFSTINAGNVLGFKKGDTITIQTLQLDLEEAEVTEIVMNYLGNAVYMTQAKYEELFGEFEPNGALILLKGQNHKEFAEKLSQKDSILSAIAKETLKDGFAPAFQIINMVVYIVIFLAGALAFVVLFTLATTNISERERELATIKVLGFYDKEVHSYVNKETLILTSLGILIGLPAGNFLGSWLMSVLNMPAIYFVPTITPISYGISAIISFGFALIVNFITDRSLDVINPVEALKSIE